MVRHGTIAGLVLLCWLALPAAALAETIEEIVAWVNGEIITKSEYDEEEQVRVAEAYRRLSGEELDRTVTKMREQLLVEMINRKILVNHAQALGYDLDKMGDVFFQQFKEQQGVEDEAEFNRELERQGMTKESLKRRLVEMYAPEEVVRFEVTSRISVSDGEIEAFYAENPAQFVVPGEVTFREIVILADADDGEREARREEAFELLRRVREGEEFAEVAKLHSEAGTRESGGLIGPIKRGDLSVSLGDLAFTVPVGETSDVIDAAYGFHIIQIESRQDQTKTTLDDVGDRLRAFLEDRKYQDELAAFLEKARENSEWCVKPKYEELLSIPTKGQCQTS